MGMFFEEHILDKLLPELADFLTEKFQVKQVKITKKFQDSCGVNNEGICVHFYGGESTERLERGYYKVQGCFSLTAFPGNCGMVVSHSLWLSEKSRGKGLGSFLQYFKKKIASKYGFSLMYCTTIVTNDVENHLLEKFGWKKVNTFLNRRTGNTCYEWVVYVPETI